MNIFIIDATGQQIKRPKRKQKKYCLGKKKKHTIKNQLVVTGKGKIPSVSSSNPGSKHDKRIHDETKLTYDINFQPISDLGYFVSTGITMPIKKPS